MRSQTDSQRLIGSDGIFRLMVVFSLSFLVQVLLMDRLLNIYDEGIPLTGGMLSASGAMVYRDFYANYGPAQFTVIGWLFEWFGPQVLVVRLYDIAVRSGIVVTMYLMARQVAGFRSVFLSTGMVLLWLACEGLYGSSVYPCTLLILLSSSTLFLSTKPGCSSLALLFLSGLLAGLGSLFRFDFGGVMIAAHLVTIGYSRLGPESMEGRSRGKKRLLEKLYWPIARYLSGVLVVLLPVFFNYALNRSLGRLYHDTVYFPSQNYVNTRSLPWVGVDRLEGLMGFRDFMVYYPMIAVVISALLLRSEKIPRELRTFVLLCVCLIVPLTIKGSVRVSVIHMQPAIVLAFGLMAPFWGLLFNSDRRSFKLSGILAAGFVLAASCDLLLNRIFETRFPVLRDVSGFFSAWHEKKFLGSVSEHSSAMFLVETFRYEAIATLDRCADRNDTVFLGRGRHDQLMVNDVLSYFLLGRKPATKWYHFDPGLQTSRRIQEEMIADLIHNEPEYLWLDSTDDGYYEPNDSRFSSGVTLLDQFIRDRYWPLAQVGVIEIMRRRDVVPGFGCPI